MRLAVLLIALCAGSAMAQGRTFDNTGRITVMAGYRWANNEWFASHAATAGTPFVPGIGGIQGTASFGYGLLEWFEVAIDAFATYEGFKLEGVDSFGAITYGALIGIRFTRSDWPFRGVAPHLGLHTGPTLSMVSSAAIPGTEKFQNGYAAVGGLTWRFAERFGITLDVRYLFARHYVADIAGFNVGGLTISLGFTSYVLPAPKTETNDMLTF